MSDSYSSQMPYFERNPFTIRVVSLTKDQTISGINFKKGSKITISEGYDSHNHKIFKDAQESISQYLSSAESSEDLVINGITYKKGATIEFQDSLDQGAKPIKGTLGKDSIINGITFKALTTVSIDWTRKFITGTLARNATIESIEYAANHEIQILDDRTTGTLAKNMTIYGIEFASNTIFDVTLIAKNKDSKVVTGFLAKDQNVASILLPNGTKVVLTVYKDTYTNGGKIRRIETKLPKDLSIRKFKILGLNLKDSSNLTIDTYPQTTIKAVLGETTVINSIQYTKNSDIIIEIGWIGGKENQIQVLTGTLAKDQIIPINLNSPNSPKLKIKGGSVFSQRLGKIDSGTLKENTIIDNIEYASNSAIGFRHLDYPTKTIVSSGVLAKDTKIGEVLIKRGSKVDFNFEGKIERISPPDNSSKETPTKNAETKIVKIGEIEYDSNFELVIGSNGKVERGVLANDTKFERGTLRKGTEIMFNENGTFRSINPPEKCQKGAYSIKIDGFDWDAANNKIILNEKGNVNYGVLFSDAKLNGINFPKGSEIGSSNLNDPSPIIENLTTVVISKNANILGTEFPKGSRFNFENGKPSYVRLDKKDDYIVFNNIKIRPPLGPDRTCDAPGTQMVPDSMPLSPSWKVLSGLLYEDQKINGYPFMKDMEISFYEDGKFKGGSSPEGTVVGDYKLDSHAKIFFTPQTIPKVIGYATSIKSVKLNNMEFGPGTRFDFDENGGPERVWLNEVKKINGIDFPKESDIWFQKDSDKIFCIMIPINMTINGITYRERSSIYFHQNSGKFRSGSLLNDQKISNIFLSKDTEVVFDEKGIVVRGISAKDQVVNGKKYKHGETIDLSKPTK